MEARELENGNLLVPVAAEDPGGALFDEMFEIGPDHPDSEKWRPSVGGTRHQTVSPDTPKPEAG